MTKKFAEQCEVQGCSKTSEWGLRLLRADLITQGFEELCLKPGDVVEFDARVTPYLKGYKGNREDEDLPPVERDYRLSYPTKFEKVGEARLQSDAVALDKFMEVKP